MRSINPWQVCEGNMGPWQAQMWQEHEGTLSRAAGVLLAFWLAEGGEGAELFQVVFFPLASIAFTLQMCFLNSSMGVRSSLNSSGF